MKKRLYIILFTLIFSTMCVMPVFAQNEMAAYVVDDAGLLTDSEENSLNETLKEISNRQNCQVVVVTTNSLDGKSAEAYADDYYDYNGYGKDGILLLVSMEDRDYGISTCGYATEAFTDAGINYIENKFLDDLSAGNYEKAFSTYAKQCDKSLTQAKEGAAYDSSNMPHEPLSSMWILISFVAGLVIALIIVACMIAKLKSVHMQAAAGNYVKDGSVDISEMRDLYLYSNITKRARPKNDNNNGGGSSTHISSSGETHGGTSGKF